MTATDRDARQIAHVRQTIVAKAGGELLDAMLRSTQANGEMTALEWMEALQVASDRFRRDALKDEWAELAVNDGGGTHV